MSTVIFQKNQKNFGQLFRFDPVLAFLSNMAILLKQKLIEIYPGVSSYIKLAYYHSRMGKIKKAIKVLKNAFSCLFFYILLFSVSQLFFPVFYEGPLVDITLISYYFRYNGLNFTGIIVMIALSFIAFIYVSKKPKDESNNSIYVLVHSRGGKTRKDGASHAGLCGRAEDGWFCNSCNQEWRSACL